MLGKYGRKISVGRIIWAPVPFKPYKNTYGLGTDFGQCFRFSGSFNQNFPVGITLEKAFIVIIYSC